MLLQPPARDELGLDIAGTGDTFPVCDAIRSVPELVALRSESNELTRFKAIVKGLPEQGSQTLIARIETTADPLVLWALHLELDKREIPPALRWPMCETSEQAVFITWLADLYWFAKRNPKHMPGIRSWSQLFKHPLASSKWHHAAHALYLYGYRRNGSSHYFSKGLGLTIQQRQPLMMFQTNQMRADRGALKELPELREQLYSHAMEHRDKSGQHGPRAIANRRLEMWKVYLLSGKNQTAATRYYKQLTGQTISRQALAKQLSIVSEVQKTVDQC